MFRKLFAHVLLILTVFAFMMAAFALVATVSDQRNAGYLGMRLLDDRHPALAPQAGDGTMVVAAPKQDDASAVYLKGRAPAFPPLPLTIGYRAMVNDHPQAVAGLTGPPTAFFFTGANDPDPRALLKSTWGWNSGIYGVVGGE